jgi:hypothetical protein
LFSSNLISILDFSYTHQIGIFDMKKIFVGLSLSLKLGFTPSFALALEYKSQLDLSQSVDSVAGENILYTKAMQLVQ